MAAQVGASDGQDVWIYDLARNTFSRLTFGAGNEEFPTWTPDGTRVAFGPPVSWKAADGTGEVETLGGDGSWSPQAFTPDGRTVIVRQNTGGKRELGVLTLDDGHVERLMESEFSQRNAALSPGRPVAGLPVQRIGGKPRFTYGRFPTWTPARWQVSSGFGYWPLWSPASDELFYMGPDEAMVVDFTAEPTFTPGSPAAMFSRGPYMTGGKPPLGRRTRWSAVPAAQARGFYGDGRRGRAAAPDHPRPELVFKSCWSGCRSPNLPDRGAYTRAHATLDTSSRKRMKNPLRVGTLGQLGAARSTNHWSPRGRRNWMIRRVRG